MGALLIWSLLFLFLFPLSHLQQMNLQQLPTPKQKVSRGVLSQWDWLWLQRWCCAPWWGSDRSCGAVSDPCPSVPKQMTTPGI